MSEKKTIENTYSSSVVGEKLEGLFKLQKVDSEVDKIKILRGELPLEVEDLELEIENLNTRLKSQTDVEDDLNNVVNSQNLKISEANTLIEKYNKQQMKVRNNREFNAINKELEFQGLEIELANKKIISLGLEIDENKEKIKLIKAKLRERKKHLKTKKEKLSDIIQSTEKEEKKLLTQKKKIQKTIETDLFETYESLRSISKRLHVSLMMSVTIVIFAFCGV